MDLVISYIIRQDSSYEECFNIKITNKMLDYYGIDKNELHIQAMDNLFKDGYHFENMTTFINQQMSLICPSMCNSSDDVYNNCDMYVLTNSIFRFGAAGMLHKELIKKFAGKTDYFIIPSSLHEILFVPVSTMPVRDLNEIICEINDKEVSPDERLSSHCYYYDAKREEIRIV